MGLSEGAVRYAARKRGASVSPRQWAGYREWGLIPEPGPEGWDPAVVDRIVAVGKLGEVVRSLPRRLLLLADARYPRSPALTRRAMQRVIPTIQKPIRKMARIDGARAVWFSGRSRSPRGEVQSLSALPPRREWPHLLDQVPDEAFAVRVRSDFHFAQALAAEVAGTDGDIADIPAEEQLILLVVRDALQFIQEGRSSGESKPAPARRKRAR